MMPNESQDVLHMSPDNRYQYLLKNIIAEQQIWILTDEHGSVMLNSEEEDCIPVWPSMDYAQQWATGEWSHCEPKAIALKDWLQRWTRGLENDDVCIAIFPNPDEEGIILFPDVFDEDIRKQG